jgi:hypothetical protein
LKSGFSSVQRTSALRRGRASLRAPQPLNAKPIAMRKIPMLSRIYARALPQLQDKPRDKINDQRKGHDGNEKHDASNNEPASAQASQNRSHGAICRDREISTYKTLRAGNINVECIAIEDTRSSKAPLRIPILGLPATSH